MLKDLLRCSAFQVKNVIEAHNVLECHHSLDFTWTQRLLFLSRVSYLTSQVNEHIITKQSLNLFRRGLLPHFYQYQMQPNLKQLTKKKRYINRLPSKA